MRTILSVFVIVFFAITGVYAFNDWNEPCTSGVCHYDLDSSQGTSSGTLKIWGSHKAISDITLAAGWHMLQCEEDELEQVVRIVCVSQSAPCSHLFSHSGPEGKIVRLPEGCGKNPFARVARSWVSRDQSMPFTLASQLRKRDGPIPVIYNLVLDVKFGDVDPLHGPIRFAIQAATIPSTSTNIDTHLPIHKRSGRQAQRSHQDIVTRAIATVKRDIQDHLDNIRDDFKKDVNNVKDAVRKNNAVDNVAHAAAEDAKSDIVHDVDKVKDDVQKDVHAVNKDVHKVVHKVKDEAQKVEKVVHKAEVEIPKIVHAVVNATEHPEATLHEIEQDAKKPFNLNKTVHFSPKFANKSITLVKTTWNCGPHLFPGFEVDASNLTGSFEGMIGFAASGTISPPHLADVRIMASISAEIAATLQVNAELTIQYDSGQHKILSFPLGGIEFPGVLSLGPEIALAVQLVVLYDLAIGTRFAMGYHVENLVLELPKKENLPQPNIGLNKGSFSLSSTPFARGVLQGAFHVIPLVELTFKLFEKFETTLDFQVDNIIVLKLPIEADEKTQVIKPRGFSEAGPAAFDARGLLHGMPLVVRSVTELALRFWHGTNMENLSGGGHAFFSLFRRVPPAGPPAVAPGPGPWPGGIGPLENTNTTKKGAVNGCVEGYFIFDVSAGFTKILPLFGFNLDQNSRLWFYRNVETLEMDCAGTSQPQGRSTMSNIMAALKAVGRLFRRSEDSKESSSNKHILSHKCPTKTSGGAWMNQIGTGVIGGGSGPDDETTYNLLSLSRTTKRT